MNKNLKRLSVSLSGQWDLAFDPNNIGKDKKWFKQFPKSVPVTVPGVWEQVRPDYDGVGWYKQSFEVKPDWKENNVRIQFGAVHYLCEVWLNSELIGTHEGGGTPFEFDITSMANVGTNTIILRIINPPMDREIEGLRSGAPLNQGNVPVGKAGWYYNYGGIWQDVQLLITPKTYIDNIYVRPYPNKKKALVQVTLINKNRAGEYQLNCSIHAGKQKKALISINKTLKLSKGTNTISVPFTFESFRYWSPDDPFLYTATATIGTDNFSVRFGMREFTIKAGHFQLNGKRITLKGYLQQGSYPKTLIFPDTKEMARKELKLVKDSGCNFVRAHLKAPNPYWLDLCDEMGILIEGEPGIGWVANSPDTERRCRIEIEGLILRDRNHPCIVFWCLMNEAYHFLGFTMPQIKRLTARLAAAGRRLDDTRLLMDTSGGGGSAGDIIGGAKVLLPNQNRKASMTDDHAYCLTPLPDNAIAEYRTAGRKGVPLFISEYGAPLIPPNHQKVLNSYSPAERKLGLEDYKLHKDFYDSLKSKFKNANLRPTFGTVDKFVKENDAVRSDEIRLITAAQRCNDTLVGTALCQLADASGELFGALDFFRNPKQLYYSFTEAMQTPLPAPEIYPRVITKGDSVNIRLTAVHEDKAEQTDGFSLEIFRSSGNLPECTKIIHGKISRATKTKPSGYIQTLYTSKQKLDLPPGEYRLRAKLLRNGRAFRAADVTFTVLPQPTISTKRVSVYDPTGITAKYLKKAGITVDAFGNNYRDKNVPILMNMNSKRTPRYMLYEDFQQLRKIAETGGTGILFNPDPAALYEYLFPTLIRPATNIMRIMGYIKKHPIFRNLPVNCVTDYVYADIVSNDYELGEDVVGAGGTVIAGGLSAHMWTRPANYTWGAGIYTIPIGLGEIIVCQMNILKALPNSRTAQIILGNLIDYAAKKIKPGGEEHLLSRCIDPGNAEPQLGN